ncbi:GNAT family N-acetyltransferase [Konateibacter massiliensis]|uniref:GNAT family N-acetyltransferase n=1 Tax=Konateibacter massiliensis TaxID=2002841 RepID=UPI000C1579B4|nr:GNAT family N-acetyltransferase [Konateibacter massiliensis]
MSIEIREFCKEDVGQMIEIWNEVVKEGVAYPQTELLDEESGLALFERQSFTGVAVDTVSKEVLGLYILHPNNIGRCGHISNASYAVSSRARGQKIGEKLVCDSIEQGKRLGFLILQFNAVVKSNEKALHLYEKLGFTRLGVIPKGFRMDDGSYEDIVPHYKML